MNHQSAHRTHVSSDSTVKRWIHLGVLAFMSLTPAHAAFVGPYALNQFTLTATNLNPGDLIPPNGFASITPEGWLSLTGSHTGSGLFPGANTDLTIQARGTGQVKFDWSYTSLDIPEYDIAGYLLAAEFTALADTSGLSGSVTFTVNANEVFGFRVWTLDNEGEPGVLTIKNFSAPVAGSSAVPEAGTSTLMTLGAATSLMARRYMRGRRTQSGGEAR